MSAEWYDDRRNLAAVARYMNAQGDSAAEVAYMLEKPWKFEEDWRLSKPEGVGTGAGEGATGQDTGTAWVTRSEDCPEAPAQAHPLAIDPAGQVAARVRRFLDARDGYFPIDVLAVVSRTGDRLLASDLRALVEALTRVEALAEQFEGYGHGAYNVHPAKNLPCSACDMLADIEAASTGRTYCAPFYCYPCARGDHDEHKLAWVPDIPCECPECVIPPGNDDA